MILRNILPHKRLVNVTLHLFLYPQMEVVMHALVSAEVFFPCACSFRLNINFIVTIQDK